MYTIKKSKLQFEQKVTESENLQTAVLKYKRTNDSADFNAIYELTDRRRHEAVTRAVLRYNRAEVAELTAATDDALVDALKRYKSDSDVPFSAFLGFVSGRKISRYIQSTYFTGKDRKVERPVVTDVTLVPESATAHTPDYDIHNTMEHIKSVDNVLYEVTFMLVNGWNEETVGRVIGRRTTTQAAKSWTRRQRSKVAVLLAQ